MLKCWSTDPEDRPTFSECVTYLKAYLADRKFTLPSNSNNNKLAGDYVGVNEGGYLPLEGDEEHRTKYGYMLPTGDGQSDDRHRSESRPYQNLGGATNSSDYDNNGGKI
jgi:hypothetical protein